MVTSWSNFNGGLARPSSSLLMGLMTAMSILTAVTTFNVDVDKRVVHTLPYDDHQWFGFSVALHVHQSTGWLLIGAPRAKTSQKDVTRGGAVYKCRPDIPSACQIIPFDTKGNSYVEIKGERVDTDNKTEQWFGATVISSGVDGNIVACAPRYVYHSPNLRRREPVGTCYVSRSSFSEFKEYAPCRTNAWGYHRQGSCQAGLSAAISKDGQRLFIGAVGSWYWQGQVFSQNLLDTSDKIGTNEDAQAFDTSYMGFSAAVGEFSGDDKEDVVVGRPRGGNLTGQVLLFNSTLYSLFNITGEQIGSYFGYSVTVVDLNGDKLDDIVVGAPLYNDYSAKDKSFETGRIYVFYQTKKHEFRTWDFIDGKKSKGRFGLSVASLASINMDKWGDVCVGAPYDGDEGRGVIYIFHGSRSGIQEKASQIIKAEDIDSKISTFGFSLSGGLDLDSNEYPDLLVGGYNSDSAVFFRSRPVVYLNTSISFFSENINLDTAHCNLKNGSSVSCVPLTICSRYNGRALKSNMAVTNTYTLDANKKDESRLFFHKFEGQNVMTETVTLTMNNERCRSFYVYVKIDIRDKLTPITVKAVSELFRKKRHRKSRKLLPILNNNEPSTAEAKISIQKECGSDLICIPDIRTNVSLSQATYVIGQKNKLELEFFIVNVGEDAYEATFYLEMSPLVDFVKVQMSASRQYLIHCNAPEKNDSNTLKCYLGNPLPSGQSINFSVHLSAKSFIHGAESFDFLATTNSTNPEVYNTTHDNEIFIEVPIRVNCSLNTFGISSPWTIFFNESHYANIKELKSEHNVGPEVIHTYGLNNPGISPILQVNVSILWPIQTETGDALLYMTSQPMIFGNGTCDHVPYVNEMNLTLDHNRSRNKYLENLQSETELMVRNEYADGSTKRRTRRSLPDNPQHSSLKNFIPCGRALCIEINCTLYNITKKVAFVSLPGRLWTKTIRKLKLSRVSIISQMTATVHQLPSNVDPSYLEPVSAMITTTAVAQVVRDWLWIIVLAICIGILLLVIIMIILWKLGFFKRKRPQDEKEFQNNSIGYHTPKGDEAFL